MLNESELMTDGPQKSKSVAKPPQTRDVDSSDRESVNGTPGLVLTIDGPAASGKSSVSRELARRLGWRWVSTGTFYRGIAWAAHETGVDLEDEGELVRFIESGRWKVELTAPTTCFFLDGFDRTDEITKEAVGSLASKISSYPRVRVALLDAQRKCASSDQGLIAEGRDCGTVVFPHAQVKVFLTARAEDRAQRRANDEGRSLEETISDQKQRDRQDANRKAAPMVAPEGALKIDTSQFSFLEVVEKIEALVVATIPIQKNI
jgi:CMP/dCMP kinase